MPKYNIYQTKADYQKIYDELKAIENPQDPWNWKKIKSANYDQLHMLLNISKRQSNKKS